MQNYAHDRSILRSLVEVLAAKSQLPIQAERRQLWAANNDLKPQRSPVMVLEMPWAELEKTSDELQPQCNDSFLRSVEIDIRRKLYIEKHLQTDQVIEDCYWIWKKIDGRGFGLDIQEDTVETLTGSEVKAHHYTPIICDENDVEKIQFPQVSYDQTTTEQQAALLNDIFGDLMPVRIQGQRTLTYNSWDIIICWTGIQEALMDLLDEPDYIHALVRRLTDAHLSLIDQLDQLNLFDNPNPRERVGSGGSGYTNDLPSANYDPGHFHPLDVWGSATSQIFSEVSPTMHKEFALDYEKEFLDRCGLSYYGCCEPLHNKMQILDGISNLRKVSISPWCDTALAYANATRRYVFSHKPSPAFFACDSFDLEACEAELRQRLSDSRDMPCEIILKDLSTVSSDPQRLIDWSQMAMRLSREFSP